MICPNDGQQMHQLRQIGAGIAEDALYETWEVKKCDTCGRIVKEIYRCEVIDDTEARLLEKGINGIQV